MNPKFGPEHNNAFLLEVASTDMVVDFKVKDWDRFGSNDTLGTAHIAISELAALLVVEKGKAEFAIDPPPKLQRNNNDEIKSAGWITLRVREPTEEEVETHSGSKMGSIMKQTFYRFKETAMSPKRILAPTIFPTTPKPQPDAGGEQSDEKQVQAQAQTAVVEDLKNTPDQALQQSTDNNDIVQGGPLWIEIVSGRNLLSADRTGKSDPYVKVKDAKGQDLHETKHILQNLNPIFGPESNSSFVLDPSSTSGDLVLKVKDWDLIGKNDELGQVQVSVSQLYAEAASDNSHNNKTGLELAIVPPKGREKEDAGTLTIRCRPATQQDLEQQQQNKSHRGPVLQVPSLPIFKSTPPVAAKDQLSFFIEIVSCRELLVADKTGSSDPYVKVKFGKKDIHETHHRCQT